MSTPEDMARDMAQELSDREGLIDFRVNADDWDADASIVGVTHDGTLFLEGWLKKAFEAGQKAGGSAE